MPASMLAWGSEFLFSRLMTILALVLGSDSSASDFQGSVCGFASADGLSADGLYLLIVHGCCEHQAWSTV